MSKFVPLAKLSPDCVLTREVHKVLCKHNNHLYARKRLTIRAGQEEQQRFIREVRILTKLQHQNIVKLSDSGKENGLLWYTMPLAKMCLRTYLSKFKPGENAVWILLQVAAGLDFAHNHGYVHRDVKPENILLFEADGHQNKKACLIDFGLVRDITGKFQAITDPGYPNYGTRPYIAPEQRRNASTVDERADIYPLGLILYEMLSGQDIREVPLYRLPDMESVAFPYRQVIEKAIQDNPDARFETVKKFIEAVKSAQVSAREDCLNVASPMLKLSHSR